MYACRSDRITKHPERCTKATPGERCSNYVRRTGEATSGERLRNSVRTTGNYSSSNEARRRRRRAVNAEGASRTPSGGRVITASKIYFHLIIFLDSKVLYEVMLENIHRFAVDFFCFVFLAQTIFLNKYIPSPLQTEDKIQMQWTLTTTLFLSVSNIYYRIHRIMIMTNICKNFIPFQLRI